MAGRRQIEPSTPFGRGVEIAHVGFGVADRDGLISYANPRLAQILGRADPVGMTLPALGIAPDGGPHEHLIHRPDGTALWTLIERSALPDDPADASSHLFSVSDIDALKRGRGAGPGGVPPTGFAEFARLGICRLDIESGTIVEVNDVLAAIYGYEPRELVGADWRLLAGIERPENEPLADIAELGLAIAEGRLRTSEGERVVTRRDGSAIRVRAAIAVSPGEDGRPRYLTGVAQDVTGLRAVEERIRHQALHDSLTGLANRTRFAQLIEAAAGRPASERGWVAVLFLDLTQFKLVNDGLGHLAGDELLRAVAHRFDDAVFGSETVIRFGGDEFVVFSTGINRVEDAEELARRVLGSL